MSVPPSSNEVPSAPFEGSVLVDGAHLWVSVCGGGPPLVLCHGGPGLHDYLEPLGRMVEDLATVIRYDQRGSGRSEDRPPYTVARFVADLEGLRRHFDFRRWVVGGHSWGANLALAYALEHPHRVGALLYLSGTGIDPAWHEAYRRAREARLSPQDRARFRRLRRRIATAAPEEVESLREEVSRIVRPTDFHDPTRWDRVPGDDAFPANYEVNRLLNRDWERTLAQEDLEARVQALSAPALVLHGEGDPRPRWAPEALARLLPRGRFVLLRQAGHDPWWENAPALRRALRRFLREVQGERTRRDSNPGPPA